MGSREVRERDATAETRLITLSHPDEQNEYQQLVTADAREAAERAGLRLNARFAESEAMTQIAQLFECIRAEDALGPAAG